MVVLDQRSGDAGEIVARQIRGESANVERLRQSLQMTVEAKQLAAERAKLLRYGCPQGKAGVVDRRAVRLMWPGKILVLRERQSAEPCL